MRCKICDMNAELLFSTKVLGRYDVKYYGCPHCGFVQTETPYWLEEAYSNSINLTDTGLVRRNILAARSVAMVLFFLFPRKARYLDYAGGYGLFARLMRNYGFDYYTCDPYTSNLLAKGFDYNGKDSITLVTSLESFEHFEHPLQEIEKILSISPHIFFTTQLIPQPVPAPEKWWYYGTDHGQHIGFYTGKTLAFIAKRYGLRVYSVKGYHLFTTRRMPAWWFGLLVIAGRFGADSIIRFFMRSKVKDDMEQLKQQSPAYAEQQTGEYGSRV